MGEQNYQKDDDAVGLGCAMEYFADHQEVFEMIDNLQTVVQGNIGLVERAHERFTNIFKQYHEQPHLLDTHLEKILDKMISIIRDKDASMKLKHTVFQYMYVVTNVRGYKVIVGQLPHEVADFEPVLRLLEEQNPTDQDTWTTRYILLLWMSIIVMIPFHMSRLDAFDGQQNCSDKKTVMIRVLDVCKTYTVQPDKCRDAAAYLISKFLTRIDVKEKHMSEFLNWACELSSSQNSGTYVKYGTLSAVAMIIKHGKREDILPHAQKLLAWIINDEFKSNSGCNIQKLVCKIVQRIGLIYMPPRLAKWRYSRGNRSLATNLSSGDTAVHTIAIPVADEDDDQDVDVPEEIEEIIDQLIQGLKSADGVVRWSAAKGIGRVTGRLPKECADDVVGSVLELFSPREDDGAWHGGCLALAELGRRGLLLPTRLPQVVPVVVKALVYDEPRGYASVGSHIRDSACYVCWSFARAYETEDLRPFVKEIASQLLITTCFDREINCRRAASAAFQENVGRQGTFPHGIDILTAADFFAVSIRNNAFLNISVFIAKYEEYTFTLIDHLVERKVSHWDVVIRELCAKALYNLTSLAPEYMLDRVMDNLFKQSMSSDLNTRHGAVLAIGEVLLSLANCDKLFNQPKSEEVINNARELIPKYRNMHYFRGLGGELMKLACCLFIEKCSLAHMPYRDDPIAEVWLSLLNECLSYEAQNIRLAAVTALPSFLTEYYCNDNEKQCRLVDLYLKQLSGDSVQTTRMGHALALGALPAFMLESNRDRVLNALINTLVITHNTLKWAEARRDTIRAIVAIVEKIDEGCTDGNIVEIYEVLLYSLREYTQDNRGDIGAWVREASMIGLKTVTLQLIEKKRDVFSEKLIENIVVNIAQQAVEKIDRTRALAGKMFSTLIQSENIPNIPNHEEVLTIFNKETCEHLDWNSASVTFPMFSELLQYSKYTYNILLGFICSVGGLTETLQKNSSQALFNYLNKQHELKGKDEIVRICDTVVQIFNDNQKHDRITVPLLKFLERLFTSGCINVVLDDASSDFALKIFKLTQSEITACKDIYKLIDGISVFCQYLQINGEVCKSALVQLSILLCHRQSYVRKSAASKLFEAILVFGDNSVIPQCNIDKVQTLLSNTNWEEPVDTLRPIRNDICMLMRTRVPVLNRKQ